MNMPGNFGPLFALLFALTAMLLIHETSAAQSLEPVEVVNGRCITEDRSLRHGESYEEPGDCKLLTCDAKEKFLNVSTCPPLPESGEPGCTAYYLTFLDYPDCCNSELVCGTPVPVDSYE